MALISYPAVLAGLLVMVGCSAGSGSSIPPLPQPIELVDTLPTASARSALSHFTPRWFHDDAYVTSDPGWRPGQFLRNVAVVSFKPGASPWQRRAVLTAIHGTVVGGVEPVGAYYIRLREAGHPISPDSLSRVLAVLEALPQVDWADAYDVSPGSPASRR